MSFASASAIWLRAIRRKISKGDESAVSCAHSLWRMYSAGQGPTSSVGAYLAIAAAPWCGGCPTIVLFSGGHSLIGGRTFAR